MLNLNSTGILCLDFVCVFQLIYMLYQQQSLPLMSYGSFSKLNNFLMTASTMLNLKTNRNSNMTANKAKQKKDLSKVSIITKGNSVYSQGCKTAMPSNSTYQSHYISLSKKRKTALMQSSCRKKSKQSLHHKINSNPKQRSKRRANQNQSYCQPGPVTMNISSPKNINWKGSIFSSTLFSKLEQENPKNLSSFAQILGQTQNVLKQYKSRCSTLEKEKGRLRKKYNEAIKKLKRYESKG